MRSPSALLVVTGIGLAALLAGCGKADAAAEAAKPPAAAPAEGSAGAAAAPAALAALTPTGDTLSDSVLIARADRGRIMGNESGAIWVVMISDFQCPYCRQWHDASMATLQREYVATGKVRLAYLNLPLPQHKYSRAAAEAALCAGVQGAFWPFAEQLFGKQEALEKLPAVQPLLDSLALGLKLDMGEFGRCQRREAIRALVESDIQQANKAGVRSTPSFLIGDFLVEGAVPYTDFRKAVDTALVLARGAKRSR